eukprot:1012591_1
MNALSSFPIMISLFSGLFLLAAAFSTCSDSSPDGCAFIRNNVSHDTVPDLQQYSATNSTHYAHAEATDSTDLRATMDEIETPADNDTTFKGKRKKTNQGIMAMQRWHGTCHVNQGIADEVCIKMRNKTSQIFITTNLSSPSTPIITQTSIKSGSACSTAIQKEKARLCSGQISFLRELWSTHSLCLNSNVKFAEFFLNDFKTHFSG